MSNLQHSELEPAKWNRYEELSLRFFVIYFLLQIIPLDYKFYTQLFSINWVKFNFYNLIQITQYYPQFISNHPIVNWLFIVLLSVIGTISWQFVAKKQVNNDSLYYALRVAIRYRLAVGIIAYGLIKLFPLQMPYPSLSNLHTNYGDFYPWKIYFHTIGITQAYESFLGAIEVLAGVLLLYRKTATFGAGLLLGFIGNVFAANLSYNIGESNYSFFLLSLASFLLLYDLPRLYTLLFTKKVALANKFKPNFKVYNLEKIRLVFKSVVVLFLLLLGLKTFSNYQNAPYKYPQTPGVNGTYGYYNVREFKLNDQTIPYSLTNPDRWQNVVFERWATLSIKTAKPVIIDNSDSALYHENDKDRNYESAGVAGRRYFSYSYHLKDGIHLNLENKNPNHQDEKYQLTLSRLNDSTLVLTGTNEKNQRIYAVLDKVNKKYLLFEGRRKPIKL